jgi:predicted nucleic acid-binding protein
LIAVDASLLAGALVGSHPAAVARMSLEPVIHGPQVLSLEVAAVLRRFVLEQRMTDAAARAALRKLAALPLELHPHAGLLSRIWDLRDGLTVFDAAYVAVAESLDVPLVTADARLARTPGLRCVVELV